MRILIATAHRGVLGGVETYLRSLLPLLRARGHELLLHCEFSAEGAAIDDDCRNIRIVSAAELPAQHADVCLLNGLTDPAAEAYLVARFPSVLYAHNYHGTCISGSKRHGWPRATPCCRSFGVGCLAHYYPRRCGGLNPFTALDSYRLQRRRAELLRRYRAVLVASNHMATEYQRNGVPAERIAVVPLFSTGSVPDPNPPQPRRFSNRVMLVARLTELKGGRLLVAAISRAQERLRRPLTLVVAGAGPELPYIRRAATAAGVSLEVAGWVDAQRRAELMRGADLLAVPSTWPEPFGIVGLEAGCVGLPAVAFALGGIRDWLETGHSGELAPADPPSAAGLAAAILSALRSTEHWQRLREGAWQIAGRFTVDNHVERLERELRQAIKA